MSFDQPPVLFEASINTILYFWRILVIADKAIAIYVWSSQ